MLPVSCETLACCQEPWGSRHQWDGEVRTSYERNQVNTGKRGNKRSSLPKIGQPVVTLDILRKLKAVWMESEAHRDGVMLWAAAALCFFAFLGAGEMTVP